MIKPLLCIIVLSFFVNVSSAQQSWPPIGATWHYEVGIYPTFNSVTYMIITATDDTVIKGNQCRTLTKTHLFSNCTDGSDPIFIYSDSGKVYWYNSILDTFTTLYNFNAEENDSWEILVDTCPLIVTVDSINSVVVNQDTLKVFFISTNDEHFWKGTIIEGVGHSGYLIPSAYFWWCCDFCGCDMDYLHGLRCYEDTVIGHYESGLNTCDTIILSDETPLSINKEIEIYPNPAENYLHVIGVNETSYFTIYSFSGKQMLTHGLNGPEALVDVSSLASGIYLYRVGNNQFGMITINRP